MGEKQTYIKVDVTEQDIARAKVNDSYKCVVSQALARTVKDATRIETDTQTIRFTRNGQRLIYLTPYVVAGYVIAFDAGDPIVPFSFQLRQPHRVSRRLRTEKGRIKERAFNQTLAAARREAKKKSPGADTAESEERAKQSAREAYAAAAASMPGPTAIKEPSRQAPPQVFKKKHRSYGHRLLRINQKKQSAPETAEGTS